MNDADILLWDDNPSQIDLLGFEDVAAPVLAALDRDHLDPVCVGVFGPWGTGKTTVIRIVERALSDDDTTIAVYTQPWSYDPATDPKATLIGEVLNAVRAQLDPSAVERLSDRLIGLAKRVRWSRAIRLAAESALTATLPKLSELENLFGSGEEVTEPTLQGFREEFEELLSDDAFAALRRIVVIVDDLDRCLPGTVVDTLEAIKLFLAVPKMAFVVAADEAPVAHAIATAFGSGYDGSDLARQYLEKIVQIPIRIPALGQGDVEAYVAQLLLWQRLDGDQERFEPLRQTCAEARTAGQSHLVTDLGAGIEGAAGDVALAERLAPILYEELGGNPRRIKRLLNAYWVRAAIARRRGLGLEVAAFAKLVLIEEVFPREFRTMLGWLSAGTLDEQLAHLEAGGGEFPAPLRRWGRLDPALAELDVGRYLILAAALQGTTITVSSLPPELRDLADRLTATADLDRRRARSDLDDLRLADRSLLAAHVADAIRFQPSRQAELAESLVAIMGDSDEIASAAAAVLERMPAADVEPSLVVTLTPPGGGARPAFMDLVTTWVSSSLLSDDTSRAARMALEAGS